MPEAVLRVKTAGGEDVQRLVAELSRAVAGAHRRIEGSTRTSRQRVVRETQEAVQAQGAAYRAAAQEAVRSDQLVTRAKLRELALQGDAAKKFATLYAEMHKKATTALEGEVGKRGALTDREKRQAENLALAMVNEHERSERRRTQASERESRRRIDSAKREGREIAASLGAAAQAAGRTVQAAHGATQGPRMEVAQINSVLEGAFGEAGATVSEQRSMQARVWEFAQREGMDPQALAQSLQDSQSRFASLAGGTAGERGARLSRALRAAKLARDAQSNPEQVMRLAGALSDVGDEGTVDSLLRGAIGISRRGGVELGSLSRENLATIQAQMSSAVANLRRTRPNATEGEAQAEMMRAFTETMATLEVLAPRGIAGVSAGTATRQLGTALHDPLRQGLLLNRLRGEFGRDSAQVRRFFNFDRRGNATLREEFLGAEGGEAFGRAMTAVAGGDPDRVRALLGRGHRSGDRGEVLRQNQRELVAALAGQNARGQTGWDALTAVRGGAGDVTGTDLARTRAIVDGSDLTRLTRARVTGMRNARSSSWFQRTSDAAGDWLSEHPVLSSALGTGGLSVVGALGRRALPGITARMPSVGALWSNLGAALPSLKNALPSVGRGVVGTAGALASLLKPSNEDARGHTTFFDDRAAIAAMRRGGSAADAARAGTRDDLRTRDATALERAVYNGTRQALRETTINTSASPNDLIHRETLGGGGRQALE